MSEIIQLKDKKTDVVVYPQTHVNGVIGLENKDYDIMFNLGFKAWGSNQTIKISVLKGLAVVMGTFTNTTLIKNSASVQVGMIPVGIRPKYDVVSVQQGSAGYTFMILLKSSGEIIMERYRAGGDYADCKENSYLNINTCYAIGGM